MGQVQQVSLSRSYSYSSSSRLPKQAFIPGRASSSRYYYCGPRFGGRVELVGYSTVLRGYYCYRDPELRDYYYYYQYQGGLQLLPYQLNILSLGKQSFLLLKRQYVLYYIYFLPSSYLINLEILILQRGIIRLIRS